MRANAASRTKAWGRDPQAHLAAGEGELHGLLKQAGMSERDFFELARIERTAFLRWYGHPLHEWPLVLLRAHVEVLAMRKWFAEHGVDTEQFKPKTLPPMPPANKRVDLTQVKVAGGRAEYSPWTPKR